MSRNGAPSRRTQRRAQQKRAMLSKTDANEAVQLLKRDLMFARAEARMWKNRYLTLLGREAGVEIGEEE